MRIINHIRKRPRARTPCFFLCIFAHTLSHSLPHTHASICRQGQGSVESGAQLGRATLFLSLSVAHIHIHTHTHTRTHSPTHTHTVLYMLPKRASLYGGQRRGVRLSGHLSPHTHTHTHTHTGTHTNTHTHAQLSRQKGQVCMEGDEVHASKKGKT